MSATVRCLIVERHPWETGFQSEQLQIPKDAFDQFFRRAGAVEINIFASSSTRTPTRTATARLSSYARSATYRVNGVDELGRIPSVFVFIQERKEGNRLIGYDLWWEPDLALVAASFRPWRKAKDSQYGRGRLWCIVPGPLSRPLRWRGG
ncbi:MAG: hypothetical protein L6R00_02710 [Phycisphaerae bacterium]|nr:hypothetical protein [Phycisphaerae bacterium]